MPPARRDNSALLQGTLDKMILRTHQAGSEHGYGIARRIQDTSGDVLRIEEGSLYPALHRMEKRGFIEATWKKSENNRRAKYYRLTPSGKKQLQTDVAAWARLSQAISNVMQGSPAGAARTA